ncbi:armadillo-type protein, partial [Gorgonomyces haynaldii]
HRPASAQGRIVNTGGYGPPPGFNKEPQDVVDPNLMQALQTLSAQGNLTPQQIQQIQMQLAITNNSQPPARPQSAWDHKKPSTKQQQPAPIRREFTPTSPTHRPKDPPKQEVSPTNDASPLRSHLLEEFRNNKNRKYEIKDIIGSIVEFSGDQHGSRFIQQKLETCSGEEKQLVFDEILPNCLQLMTDVFGNYVIQKFFEHGNAQQKQILSKRMETHVLELSLQMYGCRVVQKAFEHVPAERQNVLIQELKGHVLKCVKDQNGNHVIQKAVERVDPAHVKFIIEAFHGQVYALATHPYGCRVIQRIFEHCSEGETRPLLDELHRYCISLIQDQYGNYVIQHILERGKPGDKQFVISKVKGNVLNMSKHKFASNVVEKCVTFGTASDRNDIIEEVAATKQDGTTPLFVMMKDQFANYVVQKLLDVASEKERIMLVTKIKPQLPSLKKFTYGKHLISKVEKYINQYGIE